MKAVLLHQLAVKLGHFSHVALDSRVQEGVMESPSVAQESFHGQACIRVPWLEA